MLHKRIQGTIRVNAMLLLAGLVALFSGSSPAIAQSAAPQPAPGLRVEKLFNGVGRSVPVVVSATPQTKRAAIVLLDGAGRTKGGPLSVRPGRIDLAVLFPDLWELRRAHYLQLLLDDQPAGSALVLQPMLSRQIPMTRIEPHPVTGAMHARIIGWRDENAPPDAPLQPPPATPTTAPPGEAPGVPDAAHEEGKTAGEDEDDEEGVVITPMTLMAPMGSPQAQSESHQPLMSGLRIFSERDVVMRTSLGEMRFAMSHAAAPNTAWNFLHLCESNFYDGVVFHRVVPLTRAGEPFVIQAGDPTSTGDGGPGWWLPIEPSDLPHDFGVISMARSDDPDSAGSQFFVCLSRAGTARLDGQYCAFGYAIEGAATIGAIASVELADVAAGRPADPPVIQSTQVVDAPPRVPGVDRRAARVGPRTAEAPKERSGRVPR